MSRTTKKSDDESLNSHSREGGARESGQAPKGNTFTSTDTIDPDIIVKTIEAYEYLNSVAQNSTSSLYPLLNNIKGGTVVLETIEKLSEKEIACERDRKKCQQDLELLGEEEALKKKRLKEQTRKSEILYQREVQEAQSNRANEEHAAKLRYDKEMADISQRFNGRLEKAASIKLKTIQEVTDLRRDIRNRYNSKKKNIEFKIQKKTNYLENLKEVREKIVFDGLFKSPSLQILKLIADVVKSRIGDAIKNAALQKNATIEDITETKQKKLSPEEERQQRRERERELRRKQSEDLNVSIHDIRSSNIGHEYASFASESQSQYSKDKTNGSNLSKSVPPRRTRDERPSFLKKWDRKKKTPSRASSSLLSSSGSTVSEGNLNDVEKKNTDNPEMVGGGVHQSSTLREQHDGEVALKLFKRMREIKSGGNYNTNSAKRATLEDRLYNDNNFLGKNNSLDESVDVSPDDDVMREYVAAVNKKPKQMNEEEIFNKVLGPLIPYEGGIDSSQTIGSQYYQTIPSDSESMTSSDAEDDSSELDSLRDKSDDSSSFSSVFAQLASGNIRGRKDSDGNQKRSRGGNFKSTRQHAYGIMCEPRVEEQKSLDNSSRFKRGKHKVRRRRKKRKRKYRSRSSCSDDKDRPVVTSEEIKSHPDIYLEGVTVNTMTKEEDKNPGCPSILPDGTRPSSYSLQFDDIADTGPFLYFTATMIDYCGYCGLHLTRCCCKCYLGHTRTECLNFCTRGFHYTYEMVCSYKELLRTITRGNESQIRDAWKEWRKHRRNKFPDKLKVLKAAFIRLFKWADANSQRWRSVDTDANSENEDETPLLAITDCTYETMNNVNVEFDAVGENIIRTALFASNTGAFPFEEGEKSDPGKVNHPLIYNEWYSKSCGTLDIHGKPTRKPPCSICGWPSIKKKCDSFTICSSCRNCQKIRDLFNIWSNQSGVKGSRRGRKKAPFNSHPKRKKRRLLRTTRFDSLGLADLPMITYGNTKDTPYRPGEMLGPNDFLYNQEPLALTYQPKEGTITESQPEQHRVNSNISHVQQSLEIAPLPNYDNTNLLNSPSYSTNEDSLLCQLDAISLQDYPFHDQQQEQLTDLLPNYTTSIFSDSLDSEL